MAASKPSLLALEKRLNCAQNPYKSLQRACVVAKALRRELTKITQYFSDEANRLNNPLREVDTLFTEAERTLRQNLPYTLRDLEKKRKTSNNRAD
ncbi:hypothetical protein CCR75_001027 [Bremia lactucae]|uniref:Uncharacterized protein n=1 Tax=Bremia lactucae TaxID=4779 RepID=A0A976II35_BRELC|nr:hypothetical protein CCR75_001027 [Bremia lactucae]